MTDPTTPGAHSAFRVLAALADLGEATAAGIAEHAGLGYSTTTPKLRTWEHTGQAERVRTDDGRTLWRLTAAGRAATATTHDRRDPADAPAATAADRPAAADAAALAGGPLPEAAPDEPAAPPTVAVHDTAVAANRTDSPDPVADPDRDTADGPTAITEPVTGQSAAVGTGTPADIEPGVIPDVGSHPGAIQALGDDASNGQPPAANDVQGGPTDQQTGAPADEPGGAPTAGGTGPGPTDGDAHVPERRSPGSMRAAVLDVCEADPERQFKVGELCRLIDAANAGTGAKKASQGAVYNAATKLAAAGTLTLTVDRPATFQLTPVGD